MTPSEAQQIIVAASEQLVSQLSLAHEAAADLGTQLNAARAELATLAADRDRLAGELANAEGRLDDARVRVPVATVREFLTHCGDADRVLVLADGVYDFDGPVELRASVVGRFGAAKTILRWPSTLTGTWIYVAADDVQIRLVTLSTRDGQMASRDARAIQPRTVRRLVVDGVVADRVGEFVNCTWRPSDVLVSGCSTSGPLSLRGYFVWLAGTRVTVRGCWIDNSTDETPIRGDGEGHVIEHNCIVNLKRPDPRTTAWDVKAGTVAIQHARNVIVRDNTLVGDADQGPLPLKDGGKPEQLCEGLVFERNQVSGGVRLRSGIKGLVFRGNAVAGVVEVYTQPEAGSGRTVEIAEWSHEGQVRR